jgi:hypothetical protein
VGSEYLEYLTDFGGRMVGSNPICGCVPWLQPQGSKLPCQVAGCSLSMWSVERSRIHIFYPASNFSVEIILRLTNLIASLISLVDSL